MNELSEEYIKSNCPYCDLSSSAYTYKLENTMSFSVVCDYHPLTEGHILIIPKEHLLSIGAYLKALYSEFIQLYEKYRQLINQIYGSVSTFEHGKLGQSVFHSHVHLLPFSGNPTTLIPEGKLHLSNLEDLDQLKSIFEKEGGYLFFSIGSEKWLVDTKLAASRFFRDRFANALGHPDKGNWKEMYINKDLMKEANKINQGTQHVLKNFDIG